MTATSTTAAPQSVGDSDELVCGGQVKVGFDEGAPTDRFTIENRSEDSIGVRSVRIDLAGAVGDLLFDTESGGNGVEVFQPFVAGGGEAVLETIPDLTDGATALELSFSTFDPDSSFSFTTDIDDRLPDSELGQIQVTGGELAGAVVVIRWDSDGALKSSEATFDDSNSLLVSQVCP